MVERKSSIEEIESKIEKSRKSILEASEEWYVHMNKRHGGYAATACHQCINYKTGIRSLWLHISELESKMGA